MKVTLPRKLLHEAVQAGNRAVSPQVSLPVLRNLMLVAEADHLRVGATDLEIAVEQKIPAQVQEAGSISVPAKMMLDVTSNLPEADVTLITNDERVMTVSCLSSQARLNCLPGDDFPPLPVVGDSLVMRIPDPYLREAIKLTRFAVADDETRPILTAVRIEIHPGELIFVATDQHRLAHYRLPLGEGSGGAAEGEIDSILVPARAMEDVGRMLRGDPDNPVEIRADGNQVGFTGAGFFLVSRTIDGRYPDYQRVMPQSFRSTATIERDQFQSALRRARILAHDSAEAQDRVILAFEGERLTLLATGAGGTSHEELDVQFSGEPITIAFNVTYLLQVATEIDSQAVELRMQQALEPAILTPVDGPDYRMLLMPMHTE